MKQGSPSTCCAGDGALALVYNTALAVQHAMHACSLQCSYCSSAAWIKLQVASMRTRLCLPRSLARPLSLPPSLSLSRHANLPRATGEQGRIHTRSCGSDLCDEGICRAVKRERKTETKGGGDRMASRKVIFCLWMSLFETGVGLSRPLLLRGSSRHQRLNIISAHTVFM